MKSGEGIDFREQARAAILAERAAREYKVMCDGVHRAHWVAGTPIPEPLEAYSGLVQCTQHQPPCSWCDYAFRLPDGSFKVKLQNDFMRAGLLLQQSAPRVLGELLAERFPLTLGHVREYLATKGDEDSLGAGCNSMYCLLSETLAQLYPGLTWRVDVRSYSYSGGLLDMPLAEQVDDLRMVFDELQGQVTKARLREYLMEKEADPFLTLSFKVSDLFGEE